MPDAYVALGSNLGQPEALMREAVERLRRDVEIVRVSSLYKTEPVGLRDQPFYVNAAAWVRTDLEAEVLLGRLAAIESAMGRQREVPMGPRTIDLDLLVYGDRRITTPELTLPHPRMSDRRFVLEPLCEIAPDLRPTEGGPSVAELLAALPPAESVERLAVAGWPP